MPHAPQLFESVAVSTHSVPQGVWLPVQLLPPPVPAVPLPVLPAVPPPPAGLQAAAKIAKQSPKSQTHAVFMANLS